MAVKFYRLRECLKEIGRYVIEEVPANPVPAAAVIRGERALFVMYWA